ncbi:hypothetical protein CKO38_14620 [Rhodospirillum rubrum]|uniref:DUF3800 domain-containing protein n=1 Tax=Rhodospirillum rubrum TaxID=1085 RepID=UPI00190599AC|nr:DUF3800 domain-containing protein [Rhodospirillum rubrum]MBK1665263.1 hypothetical protein [Rhodospirillum rubrum]MBK1677880.1 hypothetical protein [Rhodospirillum rubrum]
MQVFCDESGGSDAANTSFVLAAVSIGSTEAGRLMKSFRKATGLLGEIKGHRLDIRQRKIFFDLLCKERHAQSAAVAANRWQALGLWAMGALPEVDLYGHLLIEACWPLVGHSLARRVTITPDGGRYKKAHLASVGERLAKALQNDDRRVDVGFGDSAHVAGLQIADILANSVFQTLGPGPMAGLVNRLLLPVIDAGRLTIEPIRLTELRPPWIPPSP